VPVPTQGTILIAKGIAEKGKTEEGYAIHPPKYPPLAARMKAFSVCTLLVCALNFDGEADLQARAKAA
jgi:hypothetical protein